MIERVGSKSASKSTAGTKRPASKANTKAPRKRQKSSMASWLGVALEDLSVEEPVHEPEPELEVPWTVDPDQVFRFMHLPGGQFNTTPSYPCHVCPAISSSTYTSAITDITPELRNRVYEYAADDSHRTFPHTYAKPKKRSKSLKSKPTPEEEDRRPPLQPLPYIGLTQVCTQIRTEFRPLWLSTHRFPLYVVNDYLKTFFPAPLRLSQTTYEVQKRIASYIDPSGTLGVFVNKDCLLDTDIRSLLKHRLQFPAFKLELFSPHPDIAKPETVAKISALIHNENAKWKKYLKRNIITQVCLRQENSRVEEEVHVVIREEHAPTWMKNTTWPRRVGEGYLESLGLDAVGWRVGFGVDYS
jgi:hypothetical protein